jgi:metallo-beta-lactamase family protein
LGRRIADRSPQVRILDRVLNLRAEVVLLEAASSHADRNDFLAFLGPLAGKTEKVCLVHGEPAASEALAVALRGVGFTDVGIPDRGDVVEMG